MPRSEVDAGTRSVTDGVLVSTAGPALRISVDPRLRHLDSTELTIGDVARAERHYFAEARDGRVRRMLVVQFEGFLASNDERYVYRLPDPVVLAGETYGSWVFCSARGQGAADGPSPEDLDTQRVLDAHRLALHDELITARFARIVGEDGRRELLVFYIEPLRGLGFGLGALATEDGEVRPEFSGVATDVKARARRAFRILPPSA